MRDALDFRLRGKGLRVSLFPGGWSCRGSKTMNKGSAESFGCILSDAWVFKMEIFVE
jgi:hypothetical protein